MTPDPLKIDFASQTDLSPLEREVLTQYQGLATKLTKLSDDVKKIYQGELDRGAAECLTGQAHSLLQNMRGLERKFGLVYTQFRTAVYALQIQNEVTSEKTDRGYEDTISYSGSGQSSRNRVRQLESEDEGTYLAFEKA